MRVGVVVGVTVGVGVGVLVLVAVAVGVAVALTTRVLIVIVLFGVFASGRSLTTEAVLLIVPGAVGCTTIVTVAVPPAATLPRLQVTMPAAWEQVPWLGVAVPKMTPA